MEIGIAEKVFQYRHGNVWKQGSYPCLPNRIGLCTKED